MNNEKNDRIDKPKIDLNNMDKSSKGDENYTPFYAVEPILRYLKPKSKIWCPFDKKWSAFVVRLKEEGHNVLHTHIDCGTDFFDITKSDLGGVNYIISNPPFSTKDKVFKRLYEIGIPFIMLTTVSTIQSMKRVPMFKENGLEVLIFDGRVGYHNVRSMDKTVEGSMFGSAYFCWNVLPEKLIFEILEKFDKPLNKL